MTTITPEMEAQAGAPAARSGRAAWSTKLQAAQKAMAAGIPMVIADGRRPACSCARSCGARPMGTYFEPRTDRLAARKRWIAFALPVQGAIAVDAGARRALVERGRSLLPSGVLTVEGQFAAGDAVGVRDADGREFARGIVSLRRARARAPARARRRRTSSGCSGTARRTRSSTATTSSSSDPVIL